MFDFEILDIIIYNPIIINIVCQKLDYMNIMIFNEIAIQIRSYIKLINVNQSIYVYKMVGSKLLFIIFFLMSILYSVFSNANARTQMLPRNVFDENTKLPSMKHGALVKNKSTQSIVRGIRVCFSQGKIFPMLPKYSLVPPSGPSTRINKSHRPPFM